MISVIVPVYNEEEAVLKVLRDIHKELEGSLEHEIVIVNDGSTDRTLDKVRESGIEKLQIINHVENLGYGRSLFDGIVSAKYNCVAIIDGDGSYPANTIKKLYQHYPQYDMVVGARRGKEYKRGFIKRPTRILFNYLAEYATGKRIPDVNSGLRIFKKDIVMKFKESLCTGFSFTTTLTLIFLLNHYYVKYIPIDYYKREGKSKVNHFKDTLRAGQIITETILFYNPIKLFLLVASCNALMGIALGVLNYYTFKADFLFIIAAISIACFIPILCLGFIADQFKKLYKKHNE